MVDSKLMESWFRLMAEASRGTVAAQEALNSLAQASSPDEFARRMAQLTPGGLGSYDADSVMRMWEEWWRMMGFVPRMRYLELLEENDTLRRRLHEAEETISRLRAAQDTQQDLRASMRSADAHLQQANKAWETMFQQMLDAQSQWMQTWSEERAQSPDESIAAQADDDAAAADDSA